MENETNELAQGQAGTQTPTEEVQVNKFKYGDLHFKCSCGEDTIVQKAVKDGMQILLLCTDKHTLNLHCEKCNTSMTLYYTETPVEDIPVEEQVTANDDNKSTDFTAPVTADVSTDIN